MLPSAWPRVCRERQPLELLPPCSEVEEQAVYLLNASPLMQSAYLINSAVSGISGTQRGTYNKFSAGAQYTADATIFEAEVCVFCGEECSIS